MKAVTTKSKAPLGTHWSPLKGAWVNSKGRIIKEGTPSKTKGIIAFAVVGVLLGYMFVGSVSSKTKATTSITKIVNYNSETKANEFISVK